MTGVPRIRAWARRQLYSFFSSFGKLLGHWPGTLMTVLVLGIAMLLPLGLSVSMQNLHRIDLRQEDWGSVSVFMQPASGATGAQALAEAVAERFGADARLISPEQGMAEFLERSGFREAAELFETNPLPWVLQVTPDRESAGIDLAAARIADWLEGQPGVESVQLDHKWLQRLSGLLALGDAFARLLTVLLSVAVVFVVANTIRLDVANRANEIKVLNMVGASNGFIRQPFLYAGLWYGLLGAALALALLALGLAYLQPTVDRLQDAYGNSFSLGGPDAYGVLTVLALGGLLGLLGAWLSVQRYLRRFRVEDPVRGKARHSRPKDAANN